jgi:hypothetical protein
MEYFVVLAGIEFMISESEIGDVEQEGHYFTIG